MLFNSFEFFLFLLIVLVVYAQLGTRGQNIWLLCASYTFYGFWDWRFLALIAFSTTVDFLVARRLDTVDGKASSASIGPVPDSDDSRQSSSAAIQNRSRKRLLIVSLVCNLTLLGVFKYFNFFVDSFVALGAQIGLNLDTPTLRLLPPVGISFYTFQSMAYSIDVYRRHVKSERSFVIFALFISYFPQLVAGPIERASRLLPQFSQAREITVECVKNGLLLILFGLFKKVVIADNAGVAVDRIFTDIDSQSSATLVAGGILFTLQIYGDFSGYSNMARGMSRLFGIRMVENFKTPYLSANISEFWQRWHISLSEWLRDYLYIPLGGSRNGHTHRNLMLTMLLGGLWHGAAWTFVVWGILNGLYLVVHQWWQQRFSHLLGSETTSGALSVTSEHQHKAVAIRFLRWLTAVSITYTCVTVAFIVFRADTLSDAVDYFQGIIALRGGLPLKDFMLIGLIAFLLAPLEIIQYRHKGRLLAVRELALPWRALLYTLMAISLLLASSVDVPFIYFQF